MKCKNCGKELPDGIQFCTGCGARINAVPMKNRFCTGCGTELEPGTVFCTNCGKKQEETGREVPKKEKKKSAGKKSGNSIRISKKIIVPVALLMAVILAGFGVVKLAGAIFGGSKLQPYFYVKNGILYGIDADGDEKSVKEIDSIGFSEYYSSTCIKYSSDGKYIFYFGNYRSEGDSTLRDLYCKSVSGKGEEIRIDSNVGWEFEPVDNNKVVYSKDGELFVSDMNSRRRLSDECYTKIFSEDKKKMIFCESSKAEGDISLDTWYYTDFSLDGEKKEILTCRDDQICTNDDLSEIYYVNKAGNLMELKEMTSEKEIMKCNGSDKPITIGTEYLKDGKRTGCIVGRTVETTLLDLYINDDCRTRDELIGEPGYSWWYDSDTEYDQACKAYNGKCARDEIRESLQEGYPTIEAYSLLWGKEPEFIGLTHDNSSLDGASNTIDNSENMLLVFLKEDQEKFQKIQLSQLTDTNEDEWTYMLLSRFLDMYKIAVENSGEWDIIEFEYMPVQFMSTEDSLYIIGQEITKENLYKDDKSYSLLKYTKKGGKIGEYKVLDTEVDNYLVNINGKVGYFKNVEDNKGDFYIEEELIDYGVFENSELCSADSEKFLYYVANGELWKDLYYYDGKNKELLVEGVVSVDKLSDTQALILDSNDTLYCFNADKKEKIKEIAYGVDDCFIAVNYEE